MKKQLPTSEITNELTGASVFFQKRAREPDLEPDVHPSSTAQPEPQQPTPSPVVVNGMDDPRPEQRIPKAVAQLSQSEQMEAGNHATMPPRPHLTTLPDNQPSPLVNNQAQKPSHNQDFMPPSTREVIRKVVKQVGKEAATYRLTQSEKQQLADIVYTYKRRGYRTSDNELARIAINWLVLDYQELGEQSVLARILESLHR